MKWDYRIISRNGIEDIYEVFYEKGRPTSCTLEPVTPAPESNAECAAIQRAFDQPVLDYTDFGRP